MTKTLYWDANVFVDFFSATIGKIEILKAILEEASNGEVKIFTSVLSQVEVAYVESEKSTGILGVDTEKMMDEFWKDDVIELIEIHPFIINRSRRIIRDAKGGGYKTIKAADAIHLATAEWIKADEMHTYNLKDFEKSAQVIGMRVCHPYTAKPRLPGV